MRAVAPAAVTAVWPMRMQCVHAVRMVMGVAAVGREWGEQDWCWAGQAVGLAGNLVSRAGYGRGKLRSCRTS